jgi:hypothetical protein
LVFLVFLFGPFIRGADNMPLEVFRRYRRSFPNLAGRFRNVRRIISAPRCASTTSAGISHPSDPGGRSDPGQLRTGSDERRDHYPARRAGADDDGVVEQAV